MTNFIKAILDLLIVALLPSCSTKEENILDDFQQSEKERFIQTGDDFVRIQGRKIIFTKQKGAIKLFDFESNTAKLIAELKIFTGNEDGILGIAADPNYTTNNWNLNQS